MSVELPLNMKDEDQFCNEAFVRTLRESPEMYREFVKAIPGDADYFRERWEKDFGTKHVNILLYFYWCGQKPVAK